MTGLKLSALNQVKVLSSLYVTRTAFAYLQPYFWNQMVISLTKSILTSAGRMNFPFFH